MITGYIAGAYPDVFDVVVGTELYSPRSSFKSASDWEHRMIALNHLKNRQYLFSNSQKINEKKKIGQCRGIL